LAARLGVPEVVVFERVGSTLDVAHGRAAAGAPTGTLVIAHEQTAGRGRNGRRWSSARGHGVWLTLIEHPDPGALDLLALRIGMAAARALEPFAATSIGVKWPNDLYLDHRKLAGTLVEARWREAALEWVAVGFGVNVLAATDQPNAAGLTANTLRLDVLTVLVPALRAATKATGPLTQDEVAEYDSRDMARGRRCTEPVRGIVRGISATGSLVVERGDAIVEVRSGSLVLE